MNHVEVVASLVGPIRRRTLERIGREGLTPESLAPRLGLLPVGVEMLLGRADGWSLNEAVEVANAAGLRVEVELVAESLRERLSQYRTFSEKSLLSFQGLMRSVDLMKALFGEDGAARGEGGGE